MNVLMFRKGGIVMKEYVKEHQLKFMWACLTTILYSAAFVGISIILQYAIDQSIVGRVKKPLIVALIFILGFTFVFGLNAVSLVNFNQGMIREVRAKIVHKILSKSTSEFTKYKETDYISLMQNDVKRIEDSYVETFFSIVGALAQLTFAVVLMTKFSVIFTLVMAGMTLLMIIVPAIFSKKLGGATENVSKAQENLTEGINEVVLGYEVTKSFQKEEYRSGRFEVGNKLMQSCARRLNYLNKANLGLSNLLSFIMQMTICVIAGYFIYKGKLGYGSMVAVVQLSGSITFPLFQMFSWFPVIKSLNPIWEKIGEYIECDKDFGKEKNKDDSWEKISLNNVNYSYPDSDKKVLENINLNIERGKKYLVIGESGSGKSTLINILCGKLSPENGEVLIDGKKSGDSSRRLQYLSSGVWQNVFLFNESIKDNIIMGDDFDEGAKHKLDDVVKESVLEEMTSEKGMDFVVGLNGAQLSGGQKQRIAIARALYAKKDLLVLDEGFSALNAEMGQQIERELLSQKDKTIISISHHITDEMKSIYDEVIEVKDGTIV